MTAAPLLAIENVEIIYEPAILAVRDVSFSVRSGEVVALLGANGAGKSSLLRAVSNILGAQRGRIARGRILFDGHPTSGMPTSELVRRGLVQVLEGRHCFQGLSVEENFLVGAIGRELNNREARRELDQVYSLFPALAERRNQLTGLLSGGQQQMVAICRALMARPRLLLLDEPSMGLAPLIVSEIFRIITRLNREASLTVLIAEQNAAVALRHAHRAIVLENGAVAAAGSAEALRRRHDIRAAYLGLGSVREAPRVTASPAFSS
jgi:branched-chain amino acid transport system ATP-binding protein